MRDQKDVHNISSYRLRSQRILLYIKNARKLFVCKYDNGVLVVLPKMNLYQSIDCSHLNYF